MRFHAFALQAALDGFNGTIFAYGQTGSGKTFSITGGTDCYADRGIIPRALSMLFNEFKRRIDFSYQVWPSKSRRGIREARVMRTLCASRTCAERARTPHPR